MRATKDRAKFKGTMAEFFTFMRTDPQFYAKTPRELLSYSAYVSKKADATNPLYAPFAQMPASIPAAEQAALKAEADAVMKEVIAPAYANLLS
ncbi:MAG: hypothetical protein ACKOEC_20370, partial [Acidimicrobiia bacterium]